jgi:DNA ligase 4
MIIFYNLLLLDDTVYIKETHNIQHRRLCTLVDCITSQVDVTSCKIADFSSPNALEVLGKVFTQAIVQRWEGLVLKGCDDPYFSLNSAKAFIKLKKDYIVGLGDTADFAIVGGHREAKDEQELSLALESCGGHHSILNVWRIRKRSAALIPDRDFVSLIR